MKIDEPPTPYNRDYDSADDADDEYDDMTEGEEGKKKCGTGSGSDSEKDAGVLANVEGRKRAVSPREKGDAKAHFAEIKSALKNTKTKSRREGAPRARFFSSSEDDEADKEDDNDSECTLFFFPFSHPISYVLPCYPSLIQFHLPLISRGIQ